MILKRKNKDGSITYAVRVHRGLKRFEWVGSYRSVDYPSVRATERAAKRAEADALDRKGRRTHLTVDQYADRFLVEYRQHRKFSSYETARGSLKPFRAKFGPRKLDSISRLEAKDWAREVSPSSVPVVVTLMNQAIEDELIERNPFRGLGRRTKGRAEQPPPTEDEMQRLLDACSVLGSYAQQMRALVVFAAYSGMRPGEIFALKWADIDFDTMRVNVSLRLYRGRLDTPKSNKPKLIALTPPARDALLAVPRRSQYVFTTKAGKRLSQPVLSGYWSQVKARAGLDFAFYHATKHFCVHYMWTQLDLPERVIAAQMGWSLDETGKAIRKLLVIYGHGEVGALEQVDEAFREAKVVQLREVEGANGDHK